SQPTCGSGRTNITPDSAQSIHARADLSAWFGRELAPVMPKRAALRLVSRAGRGRRNGFWLWVLFDSTSVSLRVNARRSRIPPNPPQANCPERSFDERVEGLVSYHPGIH